MSQPTLITGMSGVGKTSVVVELRRRGFSCIEMDEPGWSHLDAQGHQHWNVDRLQGALTAAEGEGLFVSGCAEEQAALYPKFGTIILLTVPKDVMVSRILARIDNPFGQDPAEMDRILRDLEEIEPLLRQRCTHEIVTTVPVAAVVDRILEII
jgi:adenylate kinase family enzyme